MDQLAETWRQRYQADDWPWKRLQEQVSKASGLIKGGRSSTRLRRRLKAAVRTSSQARGDSTSEAPRPPEASPTSVKDVVEHAKAMSMMEPIAELIGRIPRNLWPRHESLVSDLASSVSNSRWEMDFRNRFGTMLKMQLADEVFKEALKRKMQRDQQARRKADAGQTRHQRRLSSFYMLDRRSRGTGVPKSENLEPTLADLLYEMEHWGMPTSEMPGWWLQLVVCLKRRAKKLTRKRLTALYLKLVFIAVVSMLVGSMQAATLADVNMLGLLYMLTNSLFAIIFAAGAIEVLGDPREREFLAHEAASGVSASAEAYARLLLDVLVLIPLVVAFALPLQALCSMPLNEWQLIGLDLCVAWAVSCLGYVISLSVPSNAILATAAITFVLFACLSGLMMGPSDAPTLAWLFWWNPGFVAYVDLAMHNVQELPFALRRYMLVSRYVVKGIMPENATLAAQWEYDSSLWVWHTRGSLFLFGLLGRVLAVVIFSGRERAPNPAHLRHVAFAQLRRLVTRRTSGLRKKRLVEPSRSAHHSLAEEGSGPSPAAGDALLSPINWGRSDLEAADDANRAPTTGGTLVPLTNSSVAQLEAVDDIRRAHERLTALSYEVDEVARPPSDPDRLADLEVAVHVESGQLRDLEEWGDPESLRADLFATAKAPTPAAVAAPATAVLRRKKSAPIPPGMPPGVIGAPQPRPKPLRVAVRL